MDVLITGITRGIGRAVAEAFAAEGATVVGCARDADALEETVDAVEAAGAEQAVGLRADVRDEFDVERLVETAARASEEGIDVVIANAGIYHGKPGETPLDEASYSAFDDHVRTNARGVFATLREACPHLAADARMLVPTGRIAREATPGVGTYAVSKAAAEAIARGFAADTDATVGCVDPGRVGTDLSGEGGRDPAEVAEMFVWAATEAPADDLNASVVDLRQWMQATR